MILNKWIYGIMSAVMLAACSSDDVVTPDIKEPIETVQGYIGINIQLPSVSSTRANDNFDDGVISEYTVKDASLLLFQVPGPEASMTEEQKMASATFIGAFNLAEGTMAEEAESNPNVSVRRIRVASVSGVEQGKSIYALVLVNGRQMGMYGSDEAAPSWITNDMTIRDLQEAVVKVAPADEEDTSAVRLFRRDNETDNYAASIFMTNSPLCSITGTALGGTTVGTLPVLVNLNNTLYKTEAEALANPAGTIYVERAVSKVTCSNFMENADKAGNYKKTGIKVKYGDVDYELVVTDIYWDMAQNMAESFLVRNTNRKLDQAGTDYLWKWNYAINNYYRMISGASGITMNNVAYYRPYFCRVPGYGVKGNSPTTGNPSNFHENKNFIKRTMKLEDARKWNDKKALYPCENTFPVEYMNYANSSRVGFWVKLGLYDGTNVKEGNFYIKGRDKTVIYMDDKDGNNPLVNWALDYLSKNVELENAVKAAQADGTDLSKLNLSDILEFDVSTADNGMLEIDEVRFKENLANDDKVGDFFKAQPDMDFEEITDVLNLLGEFYKYDKGYAFYEVRIKHFGDDLTPWDKNAHPTATTIRESYGEAGEQRNINFLGRYGMVRNNWYDINVNTLLKLGDPADPARWDSDWPGRPDDNVEQYIAVRLRVLSWAKRIQNVDF